MMNCSTNCLNQGICSINYTCQCTPCYMGDRCEINVNVMKFSLTSAMFWDIRQAAESSSGLNLPKFGYTLIIALLLFSAIVNNLICLRTFLIPQIRLTNCGVFQNLYCLMGLWTIIGMQMRMLTMLSFDQLIFTYAYRYLACNIIPVLVILMGNMCMWISALLAIEFVLLECFDVNLYRTRWFSVISFLIVFLFIVASHLHEIIGRRPSIDPYRPQTYTCTFIYPLPLDLFDKVLRACHVIIPCAIHFVSSVAILISISRRTVFTRSLDNPWGVFLTTCCKRKHFFIPPIFFIVCNLPHLVLHLIDGCEDARDLVVLRRHVSFNILVYLPPSCTFFIYIYPAPSYMHQFRRTSFGRVIKRCCSHGVQEKLSIWCTKSSTPCLLHIRPIRSI